MSGKMAASLIVLTSVGVCSGWYWRNHRHDTPIQPPITGGLFSSWPAGKPQLAIVLTGQTFGYLSPCGCSSPQKGGLERRANLMDGLRAKGWEVIGLDLGDMAATTGVSKQNQLKYRTAMRAMGGMGYAAIGLGESEFKAGLFDLLAEYTLNNPGKPPTVLADNLAGAAPPGGNGQPIAREKLFPGGANGRPMVEGFEVVARPGSPTVGIVAAIGPDVAEKVTKLDPQFVFLNNADVIPLALKRLAEHPAKPALRVLLYNGTLEQAKAVAEAFPAFQLILCQADDPEPPDLPVPANGGMTSIVQVGHKGQSVGVVGVFPKVGGGFDLRYQRVSLGEEYLTPPGAEAEKHHAVLQLMQEYADEVKKVDSLALFRQKVRSHPAQVQAPDSNLSYVGNDACKVCHPAEWEQYQQTRHSHAYKALSEVAKRPSGRQYDAECIVCHTVGFEHPTGYENAEKTPHLKNVGCENCHGPGSGHAAKPVDPKLLALLSPWKSQPSDRLPDLAFVQMMAEKSPLERGQVAMTPSQKLVEVQVNNLCQKCHDLDNDPHFDLWKYLPNIWHFQLHKGQKAPTPTRIKH